jgi:tetratricopeptide (TPR) repeat protein
LTKWENWLQLDALGAAYAEAGDFENAIKWVNKAIESAPEDSVEELSERLALYKNKQPYRQPDEEE